MLSKSLIITVLLSALMLTTVSCENQRQKDDKELIRIDAAPHANMVNQAKEDWAWISGTNWIVTTIEGQAPLPNTSLWIRFQDHTWLSGSAGCNHLSASYNRQGIDGLKITQTATTKMHCAQPQGTMQQESRFLHLLANIDAYHAEPNTLTLSTNAITMLTFTRAHPEE
ncbi:MAG: META domain-containing protein [Phycisphaerales bacterium]|nr:META domain-containing protein [Phycisphaerales bacterium]